MKNIRREFEILVKEIFDRVFSFLFLLILSPLFLVVAAIIKLDSKGPIFFSQERVGKNGKIFKIIKFRSMKVGSETEIIVKEVVLDDPRITRVGRIMRRFQIDELPQLLNILKRDMSFVGPRPTLPKQFEGQMEEAKKRFLMKPGLTGLAQVNGNKQLSWSERIKYDKYYVENFSILLDLKILFKTFLIVIFGEEEFKGETLK
jgi:lipopolysaccharide/colanic/teichoic acid biosynthesis glycosyltransferase